MEIIFMNNIPFLPPEIQRKNYPTINDFIDDIFNILIDHFYIQKIRFDKEIIKINGNQLICKSDDNCNSVEYDCSNCPFQNKHERFNHIVTGKNENSRAPGKYNEKRAIRIHWIKPIIENYSQDEILYFNKPYKGKKRHYFWAKDDNYIVVVEETKKSKFYIITAFVIDDGTYYNRLEKDYNDYLYKDYLANHM